MSLNVTIPDTFSGPLDLLLHLIRRDEMDIYDIPVARLCNAYLDEMRKLAIVDVDEAAEFLDLASRLLEIKSRMLAPPEEEEGEPDGEEDDFDPRSDLVDALLEYRKFKDAARMLGEMAEEQARRYPRVAPRLVFQDDDAPVQSDGSDLVRAFQKMLLRMMPQDESNVITYTEIPASVRVRQIEAVLLDVESTRFSLLLSGAPNRAEMVGFFIAMLELIRQGRLTARQADNFSDIVLERREPPAGRIAGSPPRRAPRAGRCFLTNVPRRAPPPRPRPGPCAGFPTPAPVRAAGPAPRKIAATGGFPVCRLGTRAARGFGIVKMRTGPGGAAGAESAGSRGFPKRHPLRSTRLRGRIFPDMEKLETP